MGRVHIGPTDHRDSIVIGLNLPCLACGHDYGRHTRGTTGPCGDSFDLMIAPMQDMMCECKGYLLYLYDLPARPTAEEMYEALRNEK